MSVVNHIPTDTEELLFSTTWDRGKDPSATCRSTATQPVDTDPDLVVDVMMAVGGRMSGEGLGDDARPFLAAMADEEGGSCSVAGLRDVCHTAPALPQQRTGGEAPALVLRDDAMGRR